MLLARGAEHPTDGGATAYATAYGAFIAAAIASMCADPVQQKLTPGGDGGGIFEVGGLTCAVRSCRAYRWTPCGFPGPSGDPPGCAGPSAANSARPRPSR